MYKPKSMFSGKRSSIGVNLDASQTGNWLGKFQFQWSDLDTQF